ncbi:unnamed protein product [Brassicogethes aeneus]|uniref:Hcy-binding domain-containing protein n=1 Tax=Brassicogethes aeneus TaxID=1431903 RepID=A0A9P0FIZ1_BRAAE|nr:unnamed protein product [Brassicogethes aeneus]
MAPPGVSSSSEVVSPSSTAHKMSGAEEKRIVVLDGGFATQLSCHVDKQIDGDVLWSSRFLATDKEAVINSHLDFLRAGSDIIMTNTYQADVKLYAKHLNMTEEEGYELIKESVELARTAIKRYSEEHPFSRQPKIVGSVGPYGASLHDGSEYTGSYAKTTPKEVIRDWHLPRISALVEAGVDMLGLETIPCKIEALVLIEMLKEKFPHVKAWLSFSVSQDGKTIANGEDFQDTVKYCYDLNPRQLIAVGVNCVAPSLVEKLINGINKDRKKNPIPLIVYPNSGESYNVEVGWINRDKCEPVETYVGKWLDMGVTWIGGCCRTYAIDVTRILREVEKWKRNQLKNQGTSQQT